MITGGHFMMTNEGPNLNPGTLESFQRAVHLFCEGRKSHAHLGLGILINDMGAVCSGSSCTISAVPSRENISLPPEYLKILEEGGLGLKDLHIFWEKHLRNRGKKMLFGQLSKNNPSFSYDNGGYVYSSPQVKIPIILTRKSAHDKYGTPACPLIMCALAMEHQRQGFNSSFNFYYVGEDNYLNVANHFVIEKGRFLAEQMGNNLDIKNVYLFNDYMLKSF